jgi:hypothetical protein
MTMRIGGFSNINDLADVSGDYEVFDDLADVGLEVGAHRRGRGRGPSNGHSYNARRLVPRVPGAPAIGIKLQPLGFNAVIFSAASGNTLNATTRPQKPFKGKRLVVDIARSGATATGLITVTDIRIGVQSQLVSTGSIGAGSFAATAFDVNMELSACTTALDITVSYANALTPTSPDTIQVATTLFGETVGS